MVPSKFRMHFICKHGHLYLEKIKILQLTVVIERKTNTKIMVRRAIISEKSLLSSYKASGIIAKRMQSRTIAEDVI